MHNILKIYKAFITVFVIFAIISFIGRVYETAILLNSAIFSTKIIFFQIIGLGHDLTLALVIAILYIILYLLLPRIDKLHKILCLIIFLAVSFLSIGLTSYFLTVYYPLDKVIFSFTIDEIRAITLSTTKGFWIESIPFILCVVTGILAFLFVKKIKHIYIIGLVFLGLFFLSTIIHAFNLEEKLTNCPSEEFMTTNKIFCLCKYNYGSNEEINLDSTTVSQNIDIYWKNHPEHKFVSKEFPLLHEENYNNDVLKNYFKAVKQKPDIVFIIVESLSRTHCGPNAKNGSCTPFLDSLIEKSLYWENHLAASERTFEVLSSSIGSLPYGRNGFTRLPNIPNHQTMMQLLSENGYRSNFFHPADFKVYTDNWLHFLTMQNIDTILDVNDFPKIPNFDIKNGSPDEVLFTKVNTILDKHTDKPQFSILLTCSMHEPYTVPNQSIYNKLLLKYLDSNKTLTDDQRSIIKKDINYTSSTFYTDYQLRKFFTEYRKKKNYENTIFVIFGDHSLYRLDPHNQIQQYNVPLIIFSPLLTKTGHFKSTTSHHDIAPTLLCFLKNACDLRLPQYTHWIGNRLETSSTINKRQIPFISVSRGCHDLLADNYYLNGKNYYLNNNFTLQRQTDTTVYRKLKNDLNNFRYINKYVCSQNKLYPSSSNYSESIIKLAQYSKPVLNNYMLNQEFVDLHDGRYSLADFINFNARVSFQMKNDETNILNTSRLVIETKSIKDDKLLSYQIAYFQRNDWNPLQKNTWQEINIGQSTNLLATEKKDSVRVKVYFWSPNLKPIDYKDIIFDFEGIKRKKKT